MILAKRTCPAGWVKDYTGMLLGAWDHEYASDYICLDENPEFFEGTRSNDDNGRTLYPILYQVYLVRLTLTTILFHVLFVLNKIYLLVCLAN